ncbi:MAG: hypothetical protein GY810_03870 [Aureispira sp.]|nr:hypothetical protein [Aureispira sp.]
MKTIKNVLAGLVGMAVIGMLFTACKKDNLLTMGMGDVEYTGFDLSDDGTVVVNGDDEMAPDGQMDADGNATAPCGCNKPLRAKCFTLVFPVQVRKHDSTTVTINSKEDMKAMLIAQMQNHPKPPKGQKGPKGKCNKKPKPRKPKLVFPVDITLQDSTTMTITSKEDLKAVVDQCKEDHQNNASTTSTVVDNS